MLTVVQMRSHGLRYGRALGGSENYLIKNYKGESWYPSLEDVWSADGTVIVSTGLDGSAKSKRAAGEVCTLLRKAKVKSHAKTILVSYGFNRSAEC